MGFTHRGGNSRRFSQTINSRNGFHYPFEFRLPNPALAALAVTAGAIKGAGLARGTGCHFSFRRSLSTPSLEENDV
jgi:hypothetical protein